MSTLEEAEALAMALSPEERELLAYRLTESEDSDPLFDEAQNNELFHRIEEYRNGTAELLSPEDVKANLRKLRDELAS